MHEKEQHPHLRFRGERHNMCNVCAATLRKKYPLCYSGDAREKKLALITGDAGACDEWLVDVAAFEDEQNASSGSKRRRVRGSAHDGTELKLSGPKHSVVGIEGSKLELRKNLGVLRPPHIFERPEHVGRPPMKDELRKLTMNGETYCGVIRDSKHGCPTGCIEITDIQFASVEMETGLADTETATRKDECDDWFKAGKQRLQMNSSESKSKEGLDIIKLGTNKRKNEDDLDDIWGPVCCKAVGGPGEGEQDTPPKRGSREPTVVRRSPQKNPCPAIDKSDTNPDKNKGSSKRAKEIATTEKVTLEIEQTLRLLSDMSTLKTVTPKHVDMLEKKLADRLTPTLIAQYAQNFDVTAELGGMLQQQDELDKLGMSCLEQARDRSGKTSLLGVPQTRNQSQAQTASF